MHRRRPDLGPVPVPQFRSFEPERAVVLSRASTPACAAAFSHAEHATVPPVVRGPVPQVRFIAPKDLTAPISDSRSGDEERRSSSHNPRRRRRGRR